MTLIKCNISVRRPLSILYPLAGLLLPRMSPRLTLVLNTLLLMLGMRGGLAGESPNRFATPSMVRGMVGLGDLFSLSWVGSCQSVNTRSHSHLPEVQPQRER